MMKNVKAVTILEKYGTLLALILLMVFVTILNPSFIEPNNLMNLLRQISINALIAFGMTFVILTGGIDLSVGSALALTGVLSAGMLVAGLNPFLTIILILIIGAILGALNGLLITWGKLAPFIVTLATMTIFRGLALVYTNGKPITGIGDSVIFQWLGKGYLFGVPIPAIIMIVIFLILRFVLQRTTFGRKTYAIGGNEKAAFISGIRVNRVKIAIYSISGTLAALAGMILMSRLNSAQPTAGVAFEMDAIAAVVLGGTSMAGGKGRISGTLIGALIIGVLNNGMNLLGISAFYQQVVKGVVIIIAVLIDRKKS